MVAKGIRKKIGNYLSRKSASRQERNIAAINLSRAAKVGVIYNATSRKDHEKVKRFVQFLREEQKDVLSLGFVDTKDEKQFIESRLSYRYFTGKDLNWIFHPDCEEARAFLEREYDILIDLNLEDCAPLEYLCSVGKATFKVGASGSYRDDQLDFMIDVSGNPTVEYLIVQVKHYLNQINNN